MVKIVTRDSCSVYARDAVINANKVRVFGAGSVVNGDRCIVAADYATVSGKRCLIYGAYAQVIGKKPIFANARAWNTAVRRGKQPTLLDGAGRIIIALPSPPRLRREHEPVPAPPPSRSSDTPGACAVCMHETANILLLPCRHVCTCTHCYIKLREATAAPAPLQCPLCKLNVSTTLEVFIN